MRRKILVYCIGVMTVFAIFIAGCEFRALTDAEKKSLDKFKKEEAAGVANSIRYIKDKRTNPPTCFAYYWGQRGVHSGGPALATINCSSIPPNLLVDDEEHGHEKEYERHNF